MTEKSDARKAFPAILGIFVLVSLQAGTEYAKTGWDGLAADMGSTDALKKRVALYSVVGAGFFTWLLIASLSRAEKTEGLLEVFCVSWLFLNCFHVLGLLFAELGLLAYWGMNALLVPVVLVQGIAAMLVADSHSDEAAPGCLLFLSLVGYHLGWAGILVARIVYRFSE